MKLEKAPRASVQQIISAYPILVTKAFKAAALLGRWISDTLKQQLESDKDAKRRLTQVAYVVCVAAIAVVAVFGGNIAFGCLLLAAFGINVAACHLAGDQSKSDNVQEKI